MIALYTILVSNCNLRIHFLKKTYRSATCTCITYADINLDYQKITPFYVKLQVFIYFANQQKDSEEDEIQLPYYSASGGGAVPYDSSFLTTEVQPNYGECPLSFCKIFKSL